MSRVRRGLRLWPFAALAIAVACGGPQDPGGIGDDCYRDDDCEYGLACVKLEGSSHRVCTNDVSGLVSSVPGPVAETPAAGGAAAAGAPATGGAPAGTAGSPATGGVPATGGAPSTPTAGAPATGAGGV